VNLSKSRYISYRQCPKKLWLEISHPELAGEVDQSIFINGTMVGELARGLFPGGELVHFNSGDQRNIPEMIRRTGELIYSGAGVIYEAAFSANSLLAICDILVRADAGADDGGGCDPGEDGRQIFDIYEVKSSTQVKDVHILDTAFQQYVLGLCGIAVRDTYLVHIDNQYVRHGALDLDALFAVERITDRTADMQRDIAGFLPDAFLVLGSPDEPACDIGPHCSDPYPCQFMAYCWSDIPERSVFEISHLSGALRFDCYYRGVLTFDDIIKSGVRLNPSQRLQVEAELNDLEIIDTKAIWQFLSRLHYPLYFLDFETFTSPVPLFDGTCPYQQIPSQYSLHYITEEGGKLGHLEFLAQEGTDPRRALAERLAGDIPPEACVLAYNMSFEKSVIRALAARFPDLARRLMAIHDNIVDLMIPFRNKHYYNKEMRGSYSIKYVLPALYPDDPALSYANLELIHDGSQAAGAFAALTSMPAEEREKVRAGLLEYCRLDTLAMVKIWEKLREIVKK